MKYYDIVFVFMILSLWKKRKTESGRYYYKPKMGGSK